MFRFLVNGIKLTSELKALDKYLGNKTGLVNIDFKKSRVWLTAESSKIENVKAGIRLAADGKTDGKFAVNSGILSGICSRRKSIILEHDKDVLKVYSPDEKYQATTEAADYESIKFPKKENSIVLSENLQNILAEALPFVALKDHYETQNISGIRVIVDNKKINIICNDPYHGSLYTAKTDSKDLDFAIPINYALILAGFLKEPTEASISLDKTNIYYWADNLKLAWPLLTSDVEIDKYKQSFEPTNKIATMDKNTIGTILENLESLYDQSSAIELTVSSKDIQLKIKTSLGTALETLPYKDKLDKGVYYVPPSIFKELLDRLDDKFYMSINNKKLYIKSRLEHGKIEYISTLLEFNE